MIEEEDNVNSMINASGIGEQDNGIVKRDYSNVNKHPYIDKVFCLIQSGQTNEVKRFFDTFPHLIRNFTSPNKWNPLMYAIRYGNIELINYFKDKEGVTLASSEVLTSFSIVHTAVYSGEFRVLEHVMNNFNAPANPLKCEISPLKAAMKANHAKMVELLVARGAYYVFNDVYNNLDIRPNAEETNKYMTLSAKNVDIPQALVVDQAAVKDCSIKQTLKYARVKSIIHLHKYASIEIEKGKEETSSFHALAKILMNDNYYSYILKAAVNKGASILQHENWSEKPEEM